jgi:two-component system sensor histidine kinase MtrB
LAFSRFWRADKARARTTGGTGLGLAIALEDARLHGGWLEAVGEPGQGSCFRLTLPRIAGASFTTSPLPLDEGFSRAGEPGVTEQFKDQSPTETGLGAMARDPLDTAPWRRGGP